MEETHREKDRHKTFVWDVTHKTLMVSIMYYYQPAYQKKI